MFQDATGTVHSLEQNPVFLPCDRCLRFRVFATFEHPTEAVRQAADNERTFWQHGLEIHDFAIRMDCAVAS